MNIINQISLAARLTRLVIAMVLLAIFVPAEAGDTNCYSGLVGGETVRLALKFGPSGQVDGLLYFYGEEGVEEVHLQGSNPKTGIMTLVDNYGFTYHLSKRLSADEIIWSGTVRDEIPITFSRPR